MVELGSGTVQRSSCRLRLWRQCRTMLNGVDSGDIGLIRVEVVITAGDAELERGLAQAAGERWIYTAGAALPQGAQAVVTVTAIDRPGNAVSRTLDN